MQHRPDFTNRDAPPLQSSLTPTFAARGCNDAINMNIRTSIWGCSVKLCVTDFKVDIMLCFGGFFGRTFLAMTKVYQALDANNVRRASVIHSDIALVTMIPSGSWNMGPKTKLSAHRHVLSPAAAEKWKGKAPRWPRWSMIGSHSDYKRKLKSSNGRLLFPRAAYL